MWNQFYALHRCARDPLHNDDCIYTPGVMVFKSDADYPQLLPEEKWYFVNVMTCAAPKFSHCVPKKKIQVIYNGVSKENIIERNRTKEAEFNILQTGAINQYKGVGTSICAVRYLIEQGYNNIHLYLAGEGNLDFCRADYNAVQENVHLLGYVREMPQLARCGGFIFLLSPIIIFKSWSAIIRTQYIIPKQKDGIFILSVSTGAAVNLVLNTLLIPRFEGTGAIIGTFFAELSVCLVQFIRVRKEINFIGYLKDGISFCAIGLVMFVSIYWMKNLNLSNFVIVMFQAIIGAIIYLLLSAVYMLKIKKDR